MSRVAVLAIVVEQLDQAEAVNALLHEFADMITARQGVPMRQRGISVMSVILEGEDSRISALAGRLGRIKGVSVKAAYAKT